MQLLGSFAYISAHKGELKLVVPPIPYDAVRLGKEIRHIVDRHGLSKAENILSEWTLTASLTEAKKAELQRVHNAAYIGAVLSCLQDTPIDHAHFYAVMPHGWDFSI